MNPQAAGSSPDRANLGIGTGAFLKERDDWPAAVQRAKDEAWRVIELTAIDEDRFEALSSYLADGDAALITFDRVSVHAPNRFRSSPSVVAEHIPESLRGYDLVFHPDLYRDEAPLADLGQRAVFENMDVNKRFGRTVHEMAEVFGRFPSAGFCLDVAHVWTNDRTLRLGFELLDAFGDRLRQVHLSGIEPDGTHRPTTEVDLALYEPLLARCGAVPWLLESELRIDPSTG
jgi:hypothetical protein